MNQEKIVEELDFSSEDDVERSYTQLWLELWDYIKRSGTYIMARTYSGFFLTVIPFILIFYLLFHPEEFTYENIKLIDALFSLGIILSCFFSVKKNIAENIKLPPSLLRYINKIVKELEYEMERKGRFKTNNLFFFSLLVIVFFKIVFYFFLITVFVLYIISYLILILIPIILIWSKYNDILIVKLKRDRFIKLEFAFETEILKKKFTKKRKVVDYGVFMKSNRICLKSDVICAKEHKRISEDYWLPTITKIKLYLYEYANLMNFQYKLINIILAIKEWDSFFKKKKRNKRF